MSHDKTLKLVTNLDRAAIDARLADIRKAAQAGNLAEVAGLLDGIEAQPRAELERRVKGAIKAVATRPEHRGLMAQLELVELNLPNVK